MSNAEKKSEVWDLTVSGTFRYRTTFAEPVTAAEAIELYNNEEHDDVIDVEDIALVAIEAK